MENSHLAWDSGVTLQRKNKQQKSTKKAEPIRSRQSRKISNKNTNRKWQGINRSLKIKKTPTTNLKVVERSNPCIYS